MKNSIPIRDGWELCGFDAECFDAEALIAADFPGASWMDVQVPEDVHSALMRHCIIDDPTIGTNDEACAWVEERVWVYRAAFEVPAGKPWLAFYGLDTFAEVYLNGTFVAGFENMLVEHVLYIGDFVREGKNNLVVCFYPVHMSCTGRTLPEGFWSNYSTDRAYARKASYAFGWDWTPRVLTAGIWRPVELIVEDSGLLGGLTAATVRLDADSATVRLTANCLSLPEGAVYSFRIFDREGNVVAENCGSENQVILRVENPHLWWTHDLGEPYLYSVECELLSGGVVRDGISRKIGIRTVEMQTCTEDGSNCFITVLNGRQMFARGANWVPMSNRPSDVTDEMYNQLLSQAKGAGMNLISVWGGGIYESDAFYDFCDREGLLVWQYFMFACGEYPDYDPVFVEKVRDEVSKVVNRLAHRPSIAIWIGNVECEMLCQKIRLNRPMYGAELFERRIPAWLNVLDPERYYLPSSPWGEAAMNAEGDFDRHNWDVWFQDLPYTAYAEDMTTFASEFGIHASPVLSTVRKSCGHEAGLRDFAFRYFNRDQDPDRMWYYLQTHAGEPRNLEEYIDLSMLVQAESLSFACDHYRRRFPRCGGALIWQLNDCCGAHSWSLIDVNLVPKASYYAVRQSFAPVAVSLKRIDANTTEIWCANDTPEPRDVSVRVTVGSFLGSIAHEELLKASIPTGGRLCLKRIAVGGRFYPNVIIGNRPRLYYLAAQLDGAERPQIRFFAEHKDLVMPCATLQVFRDGDRVVIRTDMFADFVKLDGDVEGLCVSDNYFHMPPGTEREISVKVLDGKPLDERELFVKALNSEKYELNARQG